MKKTTVLLCWVLLLLAGNLYAQTIQVTGKVTESGGTPVPNASIREKGTRNGVSADADGNFRITVKQGAKLVISAVGFDSKEITASASVNVSLVAESKNLSEVVVTGVGVATTRKRTSLDIASLSSKDVAKTAIQSIDQALIGKIAGAQIQQNSGEPGAPATIILRGINTVGSAQPMILVDGIQVTDISGLDVANIERVEIAKGAAAGTLYGAQGGNGVIQIFTKKGSRNRKPSITLSSRVTFDEILKGKDLTAKKHHFVTDQQGNILDANGNVLAPDQFGSWPDPQSEDFNTNFNLKNDKDYKGLPLYDHLKQAFRKAVTTISTINVAGGGDRSDYSFTASYFDQQNVLNNKFKRINLGSNIGFELFKGFNLRSISQFIFQDEDLISGTYNTNRIINIEALFLPTNNNRFLLMNSYPFINFENRNSAGYLTLKPKQQENALNPLSEREWHERFSKTNRIIQNVNANYKVNKYVELDYKYGIEIWNTDYNDFYRNPTGVPQATTAFWGTSPAGSLRTDYVKTTFQNSLATLYLKADFDQDFHLNVPIKSVTQASYDWRKFQYRSTYSKGSGLPSYPPYTIGSATTKDAGDYYQTGVTYGVLFNQTFDYGNYGGITGGFRTDYSSEFGEASKAFTFYRGTAYFRPKELFRSNTITDWKIRGAYGESGIQPSFFNGDYYTRQLTLTVATLGQGGVALAFPNTANNEALQVQVTKELELGTDISLRTGLKSWIEKINFSGSYWNRKNENVIQNAPLSLSTGAGSKIDNLINIESNGIDLSLDAEMYNSENVKWDLGVRFGRARSKVTKIFGGQTVVNGVFALIPGENIGGFYTVTALKSIDQLRPDKTRYIPEAQAGNYEIVNGMVVNKTTKRVQLTDPNDVSVVGNAYPKFNMSFINNLTLFKNLNVSFQLDWYQGNSIYNMTRQWLYRDRIHADFDKPVTINGETGAFVNYYNSLYNSVQRTGWFVENGSFLRLRDLTLTYNFTSLVKQKWVKGLNLTVGARNLFTITKYSGLDPEATSAQDSQGNTSTGVGAVKGADYFGIPNLKSYLIGINIEF